MSILKVARMGHPVLRQVAREVDPTEVRTAAFQKLIDDMIGTMVEYEGIGLAAPQVHESVRLFVAGIDGSGDNLKILPFINPVITPIGDEIVEDWEGCLSIPDLRGRVPRAREVLIRALDRRGKPFEMQLRNYPARVVQHETDHLDGVLFLERMTSLESLTFLEEFERYAVPSRD
ncbi:MAG TPA: peptide deformylase [Vicinamibacterales bacterium]